jgi:hypothetical protein
MLIQIALDIFWKLNINRVTKNSHALFNDQQFTNGLRHQPGATTNSSYVGDTTRSNQLGTYDVRGFLLTALLASSVLNLQLHQISSKPVAMLPMLSTHEMELVI